MWKLRARVLAVSVVVVLTQAWVANGQTVDESFRSDVRKLLEVTGAAQLGAQAASLMSGQLLETIRMSQPSIPDRVLEVAKQVLDSEFAKAFDGPGGLTEQMVAVYANHFTHEDVRGLLAFYSSALGKKTVTAMPAIFQEGAAVGQKWAETQTPRVADVLQRRLRAEGLIP